MLVVNKGIGVQRIKTDPTNHQYIEVSLLLEDEILTSSELKELDEFGFKIVQIVPSSERPFQQETCRDSTKVVIRKQILEDGNVTS